jgi:hypothetical protein
VVAAQVGAGHLREVPEGWAGSLRDARVVFVSSSPCRASVGAGDGVDQGIPDPTQRQVGKIKAFAIETERKGRSLASASWRVTSFNADAWSGLGR